jgi:hypothetical protein
MPTKTTRTALAAYMVERTATLALIERLHEALDNHDDASAETISWGDYAVMAETRREFQETSDRLFSEGEYAPEAR